MQFDNKFIENTKLKKSSTDNLRELNYLLIIHQQWTKLFKERLNSLIVSKIKFWKSTYKTLLKKSLIMELKIDLMNSVQLLKPLANKTNLKFLKISEKL